MDALLELLQKDARLNDEQLAERLEMAPCDVRKMITRWEADGTILGYQAVVDPAKAADGEVYAVIDVKVTPERGGGFDRMADRIAQFDQVTHCTLMSGGYDLAVTVRGRTLHEVARFVSEKLSTIEGVLSTTTHFQLKIYKQNGLMTRPMAEANRLPVAP
ncbi:MAG: Lrp/AsnC family transcriptional regulator [Verrucomicrobiales bacterium]|nr:Lrp/AsnC family transcriptional regulator [Verrucomicrobiales bacterium]